MNTKVCAEMKKKMGKIIYNYRHSLIYAVNLKTHKKTQKQKLRKLRLLSSTKGEENRIEL